MVSFRQWRAEGYARFWELLAFGLIFIATAVAATAIVASIARAVRGAKATTWGAGSGERGKGTEPDGWRVDGDFEALGSQQKGALKR